MYYLIILLLFDIITCRAGVDYFSIFYVALDPLVSDKLRRSGLHLENLGRGWGQICEQGSFEGAGLAHGKVGGSGGMLPQKIFEKRHALRSILFFFWPCITCIIYQYMCILTENLGGGGANAPLCPPPMQP